MWIEEKGNVQKALIHLAPFKLAITVGFSASYLVQVTDTSWELHDNSITQFVTKNKPNTQLQQN